MLRVEMGKGSEVTGLKRVFGIGGGRMVCGLLVLSREGARVGGKLESSSFYTRPLSEDGGASSTSLAVIQVTISFGMFTSRYLKVYFQKKSIASLPLRFLVPWYVFLLSPFSSAPSPLIKWRNTIP